MRWGDNPCWRHRLAQPNGDREMQKFLFHHDAQWRQVRLVVDRLGNQPIKQIHERRNGLRSRCDSIAIGE